MASMKMGNERLHIAGKELSCDWEGGDICFGVGTKALRLSNLNCN